jgi:uncharacterized membrane protein YcaP (DUF421 family)
MQWFSSVDWHTLFVPDTPALEIIARGSIMYLVLFCILRLVLKRQAGDVSMTDLLLIVLMADAAQNAMAANYQSLPDGILLVATLVFCSFSLEWLGFHFPAMESFVHPSPLILIHNGRFMRKNMRKELISEAELMSQLRQQGVEDVKQVKKACVEGNGKISIVRKE